MLECSRSHYICIIFYLYTMYNLFKEVIYNVLSYIYGRTDSYWLFCELVTIQ